MYKYIIGGLAIFLVSSTAFATEVSGTLSTGVSTTGLDFSLPCSPASVANGTVNPQTCAITCTSPYTLSASTCVAPASGGGGGGGGGGGFIAPTTTSTTTSSNGSGTITSTTTISGSGTSNTTASGITINTATGILYTVTRTPTGVVVTNTTNLENATVVTFSKPGAVISSSSEIRTIDISTNWAKPYIQRLIARGVVNNTENYNPDNNLTRAEFLKIIFNAAGKTVPASEASDFSDVTEAWQVQVANYAKSLGIISGQTVVTEESETLIFRPNDTISRAEVAKIIVRIFGIEVQNTQGIFADMEVSSDLTKYAEAVKSLGIFSGQIIDGVLKFRPNDSITRAEIAKVVVNTFGL